MKKKLPFAVAAVLAALLFLAWHADDSRTRLARQELEEVFLQQTRDFVGLINPVLADKVASDPSDADSPAYQVIVDQMAQASRTLPVYGFWSFAVRDGLPVTGPSAFPTASLASGLSDGGNPHLYRALLESSADLRPRVIGPYEDSRGTTFSAVVPLVDPWNGQLLMVFGSDTDAEELYGSLSAGGSSLLLVALVVVLLVTLGMVATTMLRRLLESEVFRLKKWVLVPVAVALMLGTSLFSITLFRSLNDSSVKDLSKSIGSMKGAWSEHVRSHVTLFESVTTVIEGEGHLIDAFISGDRAMIEKRGNYYYSLLNEDYVINHLLFAYEDQSVMYRAHDPGSYGDRVEHATMGLARRSSEDAWGLELYASGELCFRFVRPLKSGASVVGFLELGLGLGTLIQRAFSGSHPDILIAIDKRKLAEAQSKQGHGEPVSPDQWSEYGNILVKGRTGDQLPLEVLRWVEDEGNDFKTFEVLKVKKEHQYLAYGLINLFDIGGKNIAQLILSRDMTAEYEANRSSAFLSAGLFFVLSFSILILLWQTLSESESMVRVAFEDVKVLGEKYRIVADHTYAWECWSDPDGRLQYCSPSCEKITGYKAEEFLEDKDLFMEITRPDDRQRAGIHMETLHDGDERPMCKFDVGITTRTGEQRVISHVCQKIYDKDGKYLGRRSSNYDITTQREADQRLHVLSAAIEQSPVVTLITTIDGTIEYVNPKFTEISGYTAEEAIGKNPRILKSGETSASDYEDLWQIILSGRNWSGEFHNRRKDGSLYWESAVIAPVKDSDGRISHFLAIKEDITERRALEHRLALQSKAMDNATGYIIIADATQPDLPAIYVNKAFERITGYQASEVMGRNCRFLQGDDSNQPGLAAIRAGLQEGKACQALLRNYRKDGTSYWNDLSIAPVHDEAGRLVYYIGISNDITELMRMQGELLSNEKRLWVAQEFANIGTWDWNLKTGSLYWSGQVGKLLGSDNGNQATTYEDFLETVYPEDRPVVSAAIQHCLETSEPYQIEHRHIQSDGTVRWFQVNGNVIRDESGEALQMLGMVQDITKRKQDEQALLQSRVEADRANKAKSEFLSSMSHELRTPMNAILGFGQLLELDSTIRPPQSEYLGEIMHAGRHLLDLIDEVLDLSRIETGKLVLAIEGVDCCGLLEECRSLVKLLADRRSIDITVGQIPAQPVLADRIRLKQVLVNLLSNAIKYNRDHGKVQVDASLEESRMRIKVRDTGMGISKTRMDELFLPFNRLGAENSAIEGTGIGLTISKRLVEEMHGTIGVSSIPGKGSEFWIELPVADNWSGNGET